MDDHLTHHGIPNMKWGQRRYQNKDGSLTPAGKERYRAKRTPLQQAEADITSATKALRDAWKNPEKVTPRMSRKLDADLDNAYIRRDIIKRDAENPGSLFDKKGRCTTTGHLAEIERRKQLTPEQSDKEIKDLCRAAYDVNRTGVDKSTELRVDRLADEVRTYIVNSHKGIARIKSLEDSVEKTLSSYDEEKRIEKEFRKRGMKYSEIYETPEMQKAIADFKAGNDEIGAIVLRELGYSDTEYARRALKYLWDEDYILDGHIDKDLLHSEGGDRVSDYILVNGELCHADDVLAHYGVIGMKWGQRKAYKRLKKLAKTEAKYRATRDSDFDPFRGAASKTYDKFLTAREASKVFTDELQKADSNRKFNKAIKKELKKHFHKTGDKLYDGNDVYESDRPEDKGLPFDKTTARDYAKQIVIDTKPVGRSVKKALGDFELAEAAYHEVRKEAVDELLGSYGNREITFKSKPTLFGKRVVTKILASDYANLTIHKINSFDAQRAEAKREVVHVVSIGGDKPKPPKGYSK